MESIWSKTVRLPQGQELADDIAGGQTKNTTAKITSQHDLRYQDMIKKAGFHRAQGYAMANELAIRSYEKIVRTKAAILSILYGGSRQGFVAAGSKSGKDTDQGVVRATSYL